MGICACQYNPTFEEGYLVSCLKTLSTSSSYERTRHAASVVSHPSKTGVLVRFFGAERTGRAGLRASFVWHPAPTFPLNENLLLLQMMLHFYRIKMHWWHGLNHRWWMPCATRGKWTLRDQLTCHTRSIIIFNAVMPGLPQYERIIPLLSGGKLMIQILQRKTSEQQNLGLRRKATLLLPRLRKIGAMILVTKT